MSKMLKMPKMSPKWTTTVFVIVAIAALVALGLSIWAVVVSYQPTSHIKVSYGTSRLAQQKKRRSCGQYGGNWTARYNQELQDRAAQHQADLLQHY